MTDLSQAGRIVLTTALALGIIAFASFRVNTTHVFNPKWHPHARFHAVQLGLFFITSSGIGLWLIWGSGIGLTAAAWRAAAVPLVFWAVSSPPCWSPAPPRPDPAHPDTFPMLGVRVHGNLFFSATMMTLNLLGPYRRSRPEPQRTNR